MATGACVSGASIVQNARRNRQAPAPEQSVRTIWPGLAGALKVGAPPPLPVLLPPWRGQRGLEADMSESLHTALFGELQSRNGRQLGMASTNGFCASRSLPPAAASPRDPQPGGNQARRLTAPEALGDLHAATPRSAKATNLPSAPGSASSAVTATNAARLPQSAVQSCSWFPAGLSTAVPSTPRTPATPSKPSTASAPRRRDLLELLPPVPKWLKTELKKVKLDTNSLPGSHYTSAATLPSVCSTTSKITVTSDNIPDEELRRMFFLRDQLSGCQPLMRGEIEELYQQQCNLDRDRECLHLRAVEGRAVRRQQRLRARRLRVEASSQEVDLNTFAIAPSAEDRAAPSSGKRRRSKEATPTPQKTPVVKRNSVLSSTLEQRNSIMNKLRSKLKATTKEHGRTLTLEDFLHENKEEDPEKRSSCRKRGATSDPRYAAWYECFQQHDTDKTGTLEANEIRKVLREMGLQPRFTEEKKAASTIVTEELAKTEAGALDFNAFVLLVHRFREARNELMHPELQDMHRRGMDENGNYSMEHLRTCLECLGCRNVAGEAEWAEVLQFFEGYQNAALLYAAAETVKEIVKEPLTLKEKELTIPSANARRTLFASSETAGAPSPSPSAKTQRNLFASSEAAGAPSPSPTAKTQRSRFDSSEAAGAPSPSPSAKTQRNNAANSEAAVCGSPQPGWHSLREAFREAAMTAVVRHSGAETLAHNPSNPFDIWEILFHRAKERLNVMQCRQEIKLIEEKRLPEAHVKHFRSDIIELHTIFKQFQNDSKKLHEDYIMSCLTCCGLRQKNGTEKVLGELIVQAKQSTKEDRSRLLTKEVGMVTILEDEDEVDFAEFLTLVMLLRGMNQEENRNEMKAVFDRYDTDKSNSVQVKEILGLFSCLGITPKTKEEQFEIRIILDEVDENGDAEFSFQEFEFLVIRLNEQLDRLTRKEEELYAVEIGIPLIRCRELRDIFRASVEFDASLMSVSALRNAMQLLHLRYTSEELLSLYRNFGGEDKGGIDGKGFLRMMHSIEIAKTHGQTLRQPAGTRAISIITETRPSLNQKARAGTNFF